MDTTNDGQLNAGTDAKVNETDVKMSSTDINMTDATNNAGYYSTLPPGAFDDLECKQPDDEDDDDHKMNE